MPGLLPVPPISMLCDQSSSASSIFRLFGQSTAVLSLKLTIGRLMAARHTSVWARLLVPEAALRCIDEATQVRPRFARIHSFLDARTPPAVRNGEATARSSALARAEEA